MKALGASLLLVTLLSVAKLVGAVSVYMGTLAADQPYTLNIDNGAFAIGKTTVTVIYYLATGRPASKFEVHIVAAGARPSFLQVIPRGTRLISVEVASPPGTTVLLTTLQGLSAFSNECVSGCTLTFDVP